MFYDMLIFLPGAWCLGLPRAHVRTPVDARRAPPRAEGVVPDEDRGNTRYQVQEGKREVMPEGGSTGGTPRPRRGALL